MNRLARQIIATGLLAGLGGAAWAQTSSIYTCVDRQGRRLTSDRPIAECIDREQRELGPSGTVRRVVGPTLTEHERAALEAQRRKELDERSRVVEERRRERVLTARYPDKATHDIERASAIALIDDVIEAAAKRIGELIQQRKALDTEMEFYRKDPTKAPMNLRRQLAENGESVDEQKRFLATQDQEKRRVHQRFDAELAQLRRLWLAQHAVVAPLPPSTAAPAPAATR